MRLLLSAFFMLCVTFASAEPERWQDEWPETDFSQTLVEDWSEILSGGPPRDGIPALFDPTVIAVADEGTLQPREPVIAVELPGATPRAYPLRYLTWHEIVNDQLGDVPVAVTFCPLCNSAVVFDRRVGADELTFGVTGKLRHSDMVMYDHQSESWWQQAEGVGIVGAHTGVELTRLPVWVESWEAFVARNPQGEVMAEPDWPRDYGRNPYQGYDSSARPFLYNGEMPPHGIDPLERVVRVGDRAWPLSRLGEERRIEEAGLVLTWEGDQASALDTSRIAEGRTIASVRVRDADGADVVHDVMFAFAFHAFNPDGIWMLRQPGD